MNIKAFLNNERWLAVPDYSLPKLCAAQMARIILCSKNATLKEKHAAWQEILDTVPDEAVQVTDFFTERPKTLNLHQLLREYMDEQRRLEAEFFADEPNVVYVIDLFNRVTGDRWHNDEPFLSWETCAKEVESCLRCFEDEGPWCTEVTKYYPKVFVDSFMRELTAEFNEQGELLEMGARTMMVIPKFRDLYVDMMSLPDAKELL